MSNKTPSSNSIKREYNPVSTIRAPLSKEFEQVLSGNLVVATFEAVTSASRRIFVIHHEVKSKLGRPFPGTRLIISEKNVFENLKTAAKKIKPSGGMPTEFSRLGYNLVAVYLTDILIQSGGQEAYTEEEEPQAQSAWGKSSQGRKKNPSSRGGKSQRAPFQREIKLVGPHEAARDFARAIRDGTATTEKFAAAAAKWKHALGGKPEELEKGVLCDTIQNIRQYKSIKIADIEKYDKQFDRNKKSIDFVNRIRGDPALHEDWKRKNPGKTLSLSPAPISPFVEINRSDWNSIDSFTSNANTLVRSYMGEYKKNEGVVDVPDMKQEEFPYAEAFNGRGISFIKDLLYVKHVKEATL